MVEVEARTARWARVVTVLRAMRPPFLLLSVTNVLLGVAVVWRSGAQLWLPDVMLVMVGALAAHASVNLFNEYDDARSGLDRLTHRTPFSGGSGALQDHPAAEGAVRIAAHGALALTLLVGALCMLRHGPRVLPIGVAGVALVLSYSPWLNRHPLACLLAPGLGVGPLMVLGVVQVLSGAISVLALLVAGIAGLLGSALLLANQWPDIEADRRVGRRHVAIVYGRAMALRVYLGLAAVTAATLCAAVISGLLPRYALLALLPLAAMLLAWKGLKTHPTGDDASTALAWNVVACLVTPLVLAIVLAV